MSRPTAGQKRLWNKVFSVGCIPCLLDGKFSFPEIHHAKRHGKNDNNRVYGLCPIHHRPTAGVTGIPNRHGNPVEFEARYGDDEQLLKICMDKIK